MGKSVAILSPIAEKVPPLTFQSGMALAGYSAAHGVDLKFVGITERMMVDSGRNLLASEFLKLECEWSFWMDADMTFPKDVIIQLLETAEKKNSKMVTGVYYQRNGKHWPVLWTRDSTLESGRPVGHVYKDEYDQNEFLGAYAVPGPEAKEPFKVHSAGFGCALIHRNVFEMTDRPWFKFVDGKCSEDFYFFVTAQKKGFELWADPRPDLGHMSDPQIITKKDAYKNFEETKVNLEAIKNAS